VAREETAALKVGTPILPHVTHSVPTFSDVHLPMGRKRASSTYG
jgi:hypothetical protein